jgi:cell division protein ZapA (FtsZ GTPase activity inhibitor)
MAELRESILNPVDLVNKINPLVDKSVPDVSVLVEPISDKTITTNLVRFVDVKDSDVNSDNSDDSDDSAPVANQLDDYYMSLSAMMEDIDTSHLLLTRAVNNVSHAVSALKIDTQNMRETYASDIEEIKKEIANVKRMVFDNRNTFLAVLEKNIKAIKARLDKLETTQI